VAPNLQCQLAGIDLRSPLVLASGILGVTASSLAAVARAGAGAVTTKSFSLEPRTGHKGPTIVSFGAGLVNAVGLSNPGWEGAVAEIRSYQALKIAPLFASIFGRTVDEFVSVAERVAEAQPDLIEVNVSCPNVASEFGTPFEADMQALSAIARGVKRVAGVIPVSVKLSANFGIVERAAKTCADQGVDAITAINTVGPGMVIDTHVRRPVLANRMGGVSGPAILPVAVRSVYEIYRAVKLPIIGTGGVATAQGALQMIMAGAAAVGVGSAVYDHDLAVFAEINQDLITYLHSQGITSLAELKGAAHA
jgi:dihydroorotate dehydrogenase (NAD+) catalytic subunit